MWRVGRVGRRVRRSGGRSVSWVGVGCVDDVLECGSFKVAIRG